MTWIQAFDQPYPGALQILQAGGFLPNPSGAYADRPRARMPSPNWDRARNFAAGAIGPAIGLSPMAYGIPFPGYPSLAEQEKVGVSPAESQAWRQVYAAQQRDRGFNPLPAWCSSPITTTIGGKKWCFDKKSGGWICAEASGHCDPEGGRPAPPARLQRPRVRVRNRARSRKSRLRVKSTPRRATRLPRDWGCGYCYPNDPRGCCGFPECCYPTSVRNPSEADTCFSVCCDLHEPSGSDCGTGGKITKPGTWNCMKRCLKMPDTKAGRPGRVTTPRRVQNGCYRPGHANHPGRAIVACRMQNPAPTRLQKRMAQRGWCAKGATLCLKKTPGGSSNYCCCDKSGECVGGKIVLANPGPNGEALTVSPFCDASDCTSKHCGPCDWGAYEVPGRVDTVFEAMQRARDDVEFGMNAADQGLRDMYMPPYASPWADPSVAILAKPGGPAPINPMSTAQWQRCLPGPTVVAHPSSNTQWIPGGMP